MDLILVAVISLGAIGLIAAVILYAASKKFAVYEDPRIAKVSEVLPQANCGGCGYPGSSWFCSSSRYLLREITRLWCLLIVNGK